MAGKQLHVINTPFPTIFCMYWGEFRGYLNSFLVFLFFLTFNLLSKNGFGFWENAARSLLVSSAILVSIALLLGPLSRFFPQKFSHDLLYRKPLGIAGTIFAFLYFFIAAINTYHLDLLFMFSASNPDFLAWVFWVLTLIILGVLALASLPTNIKKLGFGNWKAMQVIGYAALLFMSLHLFFVHNNYFPTTISGKTVLSLALVTILMKALVVLLGAEKRHSSHEAEVLTTEH